MNTCLTFQSWKKKSSGASCVRRRHYPVGILDDTWQLPALPLYSGWIVVIWNYALIQGKSVQVHDCLSSIVCCDMGRILPDWTVSCLEVIPGLRHQSGEHLCLSLLLAVGEYPNHLTLSILHYTEVSKFDYVSGFHLSQVALLTYLAICYYYLNLFSIISQELLISSSNLMKPYRRNM